jgi:hypothetical protein
MTVQLVFFSKLIFVPIALCFSVSSLGFVLLVFCFPMRLFVLLDFPSIPILIPFYLSIFRF